MEPKEIIAKEEALMEREVALAGRQVNIISKEENVNERDGEVSKKENLVFSREKEVLIKELHLVDRQEKFDRFMKGQRALFNQNEQRLRDWLEKERAKTRKQRG